MRQCTLKLSLIVQQIAQMIALHSRRGCHLLLFGGTTQSAEGGDELPDRSHATGGFIRCHMTSDKVREFLNTIPMRRCWIRRCPLFLKRRRCGLSTL